MFKTILTILTLTGGIKMKISVLAKITAAAAVIACAAVPLASNAATPEEAEAVARAYGYPESYIQQAWGEYYESPELYDEDYIDGVIKKIKDTGNYIASEVPYDPNVEIPALTTTTTAVNPDTATTPDNGETPQQNGGDTQESDDITLTMPDGTTFTRISAARFIALSYEDKQRYLGTFTPEQQKVIIANFTPEEYKSMMKQLPTDKKLQVIDGMSDITDDLGMTITVDDINDDSMKLSMKNSEGELVAVSQSGAASIENTGYDRRMFYGSIAAIITAALAGLAVLVKKCFGNSTGAENE